MVFVTASKIKQRLVSQMLIFGKIFEYNSLIILNSLNICFAHFKPIKVDLSLI